MKKILLIAPPFSGHLHPLLGIGRRLAEEMEVLVASTPSGVRAAEAAGLEGRVLLADDEARIWAIGEPGVAVKNNPLGLWRQFRENVALMAAMKRELDEMMRGERPGLVIADFTVPVAGLVASDLGIPWWTTTPSPCVFETPDGPPAYFGGQLPATNAAGRLKLAAMRKATRAFKRLMVRLFRREFREFGVTGPYRDDGSEVIYSPRRILALGMAEIEFPRTYPPHFDFTGPVLYTPPFHGPPPVFAEDGRSHVLVTIGTHLPHAKRTLAAEVRRIARRHPGIVFHFTHGKAGASISGSEENFHEHDFISYADHLPRYDLVVHHAGTGVMYRCLAHGIPAVVKPVDFDQFDYAARLVAAGLAMPAGRDLEKAILSALADEGLKERCRAMSALVGRYHATERVAGWVRAHG